MTGNDIKQAQRLQEIGWMVAAYEALLRYPITPRSVLVSCLGYYKIKGNEVGGSLNIILDDGNYTDAAIESCIHWAMEAGDDFGFILGQLILKLNNKEREELDKLIWESNANI